MEFGDLLRTNRHPVIGYILRIALVLIGDFLGAVAVNNFLVPAHILAGGLTGIAQLIHHYFPVGIGTLYFLFNIPLFLVGYRYLGTRFIVLTGFGILGFSVFANIIRLPFTPPNDQLLVGLYGGVLLGISSGMLIRAGGSSGGTDIISMVYNRLTGKSVGGVSFAMNVVVVLLSMWVFGADAGMYTLVAMFAASRVVNALMHVQQRKTALIVTSKPHAIAEEIFRRLKRGSTFLHGSGSYSNTEIEVLMCALTVLEVGDLTAIVTEIDPDAFLTILDTSQVVGNFNHIPI